MAGGIIKQPKTSCESVGPVFKYINGFVNLGKEILGIEITVVIFSGLEYDPHVPVEVISMKI